MAFSHELSEKLTVLLGATALCCFAGTLPPGMVEHATVEALLGAAGLTTFLARMRRSRIETLLRRCINETEPGIDALLAAEYRNTGDPAARRDAAMQTVIAVLPLIVPQPNDYATARLTRDHVVAFYLARAAGKKPSLFGDRAEDTVPRRVLEAVIGNAWRRMMEQPEFQARLLQSTLQELLAGQDGLRQEVLGPLAGRFGTARWMARRPNRRNAPDCDHGRALQRQDDVPDMEVPERSAREDCCSPESIPFYNTTDATDAPHALRA